MAEPIDAGMDRTADPARPIGCEAASAAPHGAALDARSRDAAIVVPAKPLPTAAEMQRLIDREVQQSRSEMLLVMASEIREEACEVLSRLRRSRVERYTA